MPSQQQDHSACDIDARQPLIYWLPVALAGGLALYFVCGMTVCLAWAGGRLALSKPPLAEAIYEDAELLADQQERKSESTSINLEPVIAKSETTADPKPAVQPSNSVPPKSAALPAPRLAETDVRRAAKPSTEAILAQAPVTQPPMLDVIRQIPDPFGLGAPAVEDPQPPAPGPAPEKKGRKCYGTSVEFVTSPSEAARLANKERKLVFLIHLSGDIEEAKFT